MISARWITSRRALVPVIAGVILSSSLATAAFAADKTFTATVAPGALIAGASYGGGARSGSPLSLTITNTSNQARLGSANVTPPAGVLATAASSNVGTANVVGSVIQLRNLDLPPSGSVVVSITAQVECAANHASYTWSLITKQANDFNGTGNDLTQVGSTTNLVTGNCGIVFSKQPTSSAKTPVTITSVIYDPSGAAVTVTVEDAVGLDTVEWWSGSIALAKGDDPTGGAAILSGGLSGLVSGGSATFTPKIDRSGSGYSLIATASPTVGSPSAGTSSAGLESANFNIVDVATECEHGKSCTASAGEGNKTSAVVDAAAAGGEDGDLVIIAIADPALVVDCAGYAESSDAVEYNVTTSNGVTASDRAKVATLKLAAAFVTKSASKYEVCYSSNMPFLTKSGAPAPLVGSPPAYVGLLPACARRNPDPQQPCVVSKALDKQKNLVIVVSSPPGDPGARF